MSKRKWKRMIRIACLLLFLTSSTLILFSQSTDDYQSQTSGNWTTLGTWQRWNGTSWQTPTAAQGYPTENNGVITIRSPHTITVDASISVDQLVINSGATLNFTTTIPLVILTVLDGAGMDLTNNGTIVLTDAGSSDSRLFVYGQMENNNEVEIQVDCNLEVYGTLINNDTITVNRVGTSPYTGKIDVYGGATLQCAPNSVIGGGGNFYLADGATIEVGSSQGISAVGNTGNIQTTFERYFSQEANYIYNGVANQITGTALTEAADVIISNTKGIVTFSSVVNMNYLVIESGAKVNLNTYTHTAGVLLLPEGSYAIDSWGSSASLAINKNNIYFDVAASGIVTLTNKVYIIYLTNSTFTHCSTDPTFNAIVEVWGAGGRGSTLTSNGTGGGGGGGAYSRDIITIIPGNTYAISVGSGSSTTSAGEDSWFGITAATKLVMAKGGNSASDNNNNGASGGSALAGIGAVKYSGGNGATGATISGNNRAGGGGGSSAGINADGASPIANNTNNAYGIPNRCFGGIAPLGGGNGGNAKWGNNSGPGNPGKTPGGGGGGTRRNGTTTAIGGNGADGKIRISYTPIFPTITFVNNNLIVCRGTTSASLSYSATTGCPDLYKIRFDTTAINAGFQNVPFTTLSAGSISVAIPSSVPAGTYQGFLTIKYGVAGFPRSYPFTIKVNEPSFTTAMNPVSCYGGSDGSISITMTSANNGPYTFSINNGTTYNATFTGIYPDYLLSNLPASTYKIRIKDQTGCVSPSCP